MKLCALVLDDLGPTFTVALGCPASADSRSSEPGRARKCSLSPACAQSAPHAVLTPGTVPEHFVPYRFLVVSRQRINANAGMGTIDVQIFIQLCQTWKLFGATQAGLRGSLTPLTRLCLRCAQPGEDGTIRRRRHNVVMLYCLKWFSKCETSSGVILGYGPSCTRSFTHSFKIQKDLQYQKLILSVQHRLIQEQNLTSTTCGFAVFISSVSICALCCRNTVGDYKAPDVLCWEHDTEEKFCTQALTKTVKLLIFQNTSGSQGSE